MKDSVKYIKRVEWSDEDRCFVGSCPGVIGPCCHGDDEVAVYRQLCQIVDEWLEVIRDQDGALPEATAGLAHPGVVMASAPQPQSGGVAEGERASEQFRPADTPARR